MFDLRKKMLALAIGCLLPVGVYAQKQGDRRPPKDPDNKVVVQPKGDPKPPPNNNNQGNNKGDKRGKP